MPQRCVEIVTDQFHAADPERLPTSLEGAAVAIPVGARDVERVLRPWLSELFLRSNTFAEDTARVIQDYAPYRQTLEELHEKLESAMLTGLNRLTQGSMQIVTDQYGTRRLTLQSITWMVDDVMGLVFDSLTPFSANFVKLNDYSLRVESLSALRVLYQKYRAFYTEDELRFMMHMIRSIYPVQRYASWLVGD